jgi:hypothetical protein
MYRALDLKGMVFATKSGGAELLGLERVKIFPLYPISFGWNITAADV